MVLQVRLEIDFEKSPVPFELVVLAVFPYEVVSPQTKPQSEAFSPPVAEMLAFNVAPVAVIDEAAEVVRVGEPETQFADGSSEKIKHPPFIEEKVV